MAKKRNHQSVDIAALVYGTTDASRFWQAIETAERLGHSVELRQIRDPKGRLSQIVAETRMEIRDEPQRRSNSRAVADG